MLFHFSLNIFPFSDVGQVERGHQKRNRLAKVQTAGDHSHKTRVPVAIAVSNR